MTRADLINLARHAKDAELCFQALGMQNTAGLSIEQQVELDIKYERARRTFDAARKAYQAALQAEAEAEAANA